MPSTGRPGRRIVTFQDWTQEYGRRNPEVVGQRGFTGSNVVVYSNGALGPRPGIKQFSFTGSPPTGKILGWGYNPKFPASDNKAFWMVVGTGVYLFNGSTGLVTSAGTVAVSATRPVVGVPKGSFTYICVPGDKIYKLNHDTATTAAVAAAPVTPFPPDNIALYGEVLIANVGDAILKYSNPSDFDTWPAGNFFNVGAIPQFARAIMNQRDHLLIQMHDQLYLLRGSLGQTGAVQSPGTATLRPILIGTSVPAPQSWALLGNGQIVYVASSFFATESIGYITGSNVDYEKHVPFGDAVALIGSTNVYHVEALYLPTDWFAIGLPSGGYASKYLARVRGKLNQGTFAPSGATIRMMMKGHYGYDGDTAWFLTDDTAGGVTPKVYIWQPYLERPAFTSDATAQPGDASTTALTASFTTGEWVSEAGLECTVESVVVDFIAWTTGSGSSNHFDVSIETQRVLGAASTGSSVQTSSVQSYDDPSGSQGAATDAGVRRSIRFDFGGTAWGRGFRINIAALRGVGIERISCEVSVKEPRT